MRSPGSVGFHPEEMDALRDAQLILAGIRPEDVDMFDDFMADMILSLDAVNRNEDRLFLAKVHGAKIRGA